MKKNVRLILPCFGNIAMLVSLITLAAPGALGQAPGQADGSVEADPNHLSHGPYAELAKVPEKARAKPNPLQHDPDAAAAGGKLFEQHCAECHGAKAGGAKRGPSLMKEPVEQATPGALFWILSNGIVRHGMPDWSKLPEPQRWQLVTYLKSLGTAPSKGPKAKPANPAPALATDSASPHH